ncbi:putative lipoprotein YiaD precursor [Aquimixticola soesokkakensis]|uniref:Putative lipoprotein YiaD n=1 Tax=Aquimixticola soesokkakensis TaxID=1519096 RepID=A0A1Y5SZJ5_9RHOB|nr:OmpA family protein [Aquimixticola soesokkakensis]SLN52240.1 putative lipoprotein YiaD precursor [Aquimixticola soesokkakensis]
MIARKTTLLAAGAALALAACTTPYAYETGANAGVSGATNTQKGAVAGALLGGLAGITSGGDTKDKVLKTAVGAAIGGAVGGAIGQQLDKQAADLRASMGNNNVSIVNTGSELVVTLPQDITFATDSAVVRSDLQGDLRSLAYNLQDYSNTTVDIIGHTDNTGSASYNQDLSARRAAAVSTILTANGVTPNRIRSYGRGEDQPVATNLTEEGKAQNRRVEIVITPIQ